MRYPLFWGVFRGGQAFFDPFEVKINVYGVTLRPNFFVLFFYSSLHISSYSSLLYYIIRLLILLFLYLNLFFVLQTCRGQSLFWFIWGQSIYLCDHLILLFISLLILLFLSLLILLVLYSASSYSYLLIFKLFVVLQTCVLNTHLAKLQTWTAKLIISRGNPAKIPVWGKIRQSIPLLI